MQINKLRKLITKIGQKLLPLACFLQYTYVHINQIMETTVIMSMANLDHNI